MKLTNLIWVLVLAGATAACNSGPPIDGAPNPGGSGGSAGTGGTAGSGGTGNVGGAGEGACINEDDAAIYADLTYTNEAGDTFEGSEASSEMGADCIFGTQTSDPVLPGCRDEALRVIGGGGAIPADNQALADCVALCVQDGTADVVEPGLSDQCVACTGATVACGAAFCVAPCSSDPNAPGCIACRCENNCTQAFDECSGLPSSGDCG